MQNKKAVSKRRWLSYWARRICNYRQQQICFNISKIQYDRVVCFATASYFPL